VDVTFDPVMPHGQSFFIVSLFDTFFLTSRSRMRIRAISPAKQTANHFSLLMLKNKPYTFTGLKILHPGDLTSGIHFEY
jgi:hypothetical protein